MVYWQPGPAFWDALERDWARVEEMKKDLSSRPDAYLQGVVETGDSVKVWLVLRQRLKDINPFSYGLSGIHEPYERYKIAREVLARKVLQGKSEEELRQITNIGLIERIFSGREERLKRRVAKNLLTQG
jgi:hypothetical protein